MRTVRLDAATRLGASPACVTIGNFDGVHVGHRKLVEATVRAARASGGAAVVLTFDPHPARVLAPRDAPPALSTPAQKAEHLSALGIDVLAILTFTEAVAALAPEVFVSRVLVENLSVRRIVVGDGFRFGRGQSGGVDLLRDLGRTHGFEVEAIGPLLAAGSPVSSSRVRQAITGGDVGGARMLLGRPYLVEGRVVEGDRRGRTIGVPTANLAPENELLPGGGVYAGHCRLPDGAWRRAVVNVGRRPTFDDGEHRLEAHLLDFGGDLYGARVRVTFTQRLREERRFGGVEALVAQIREDVLRARELLPEAPDEGV